VTRREFITPLGGAAVAPALTFATHGTCAAASDAGGRVSRHRLYQAHPPPGPGQSATKEADARQQRMRVRALEQARYGRTTHFKRELLGPSLMLSASGTLVQWFKLSAMTFVDWMAA
jgi:hypothetical protein